MVAAMQTTGWRGDGACWLSLNRKDELAGRLGDCIVPGDLVYLMARSAPSLDSRSPTRRLPSEVEAADSETGSIIVQDSDDASDGTGAKGEERGDGCSSWGACTPKAAVGGEDADAATNATPAGGGAAGASLGDEDADAALQAALLASLEHNPRLEQAAATRICIYTRSRSRTCPCTCISMASWQALRNYERHHGLKPGSATSWQVQRSPAGIDGWAALDPGVHDDEDGLLVADNSGTEDGSPFKEDDDSEGGSRAPVSAGDAEEGAALQCALLESAGVRFEGSQDE